MKRCARFVVGALLSAAAFAAHATHVYSFICATVHAGSNCIGATQPGSTANTVPPVSPIPEVQVDSKQPPPPLTEGPPNQSTVVPIDASVVPLPEPSVSSLLLAGMLLLGFTLRRRKPGVAVKKSDNQVEN